MITATNMDDFAGISIGEQLAHAMVRLSILGDRSFGSADAVIDYYIAHACDEKEREMFQSLKKVMKLAKDVHE